MGLPQQLSLVVNPIKVPFYIMLDRGKMMLDLEIIPVAKIAICEFCSIVSVTIVVGTLNLARMFFSKNFLTFSAVIFAKGSTSIHLMK
ncbi:hypothetical protein A2U01_0003390 [Trifolium medium]|uniref:Uncharacterized protein n=1 Tax=Trifolium medium TaxID=97028 RepID=A0A392M5B9_9FABA|nr:hypothetical protein [Trifolium medium]